MAQENTAQVLVQVLREHRAQMINTLVEQAPAAGSGYEHTPPEQLRPRMALVVDACIEAIAQGQPDLLGQFMRKAAEARAHEGYSLDSLITLAMFTEGALSDTVELAFETDPVRRQEANRLVRSLIAAAETVLDAMASEMEPGS